IPKEFEVISSSDKDTGEMVEHGKKIFMEYGCTGCHTKTGIEQGRIAPDITGLASRDEERLEWGNAQGVDKYIGNWVFARLKDPDLLEKKAKMPYFPLTEQEMAAATMALLSDAGEDMPSQYVVSASDRENYPDLPGEFGKIVDKYRCRSCWLRGYFGLPYSLRPILTERMVNLKMSDSEVDLLVNFFTTVMVNNSIAGDKGTFTEEEVARGKRLFDKYGCISCHIMGKDGGYVGPPLTTVGDRLTAGWMFAYLKNPRYYEPWSIQPDYGFSEEDAGALAAYLTSCKEMKKDIRVSQGK
ncbi:MAG: cytochrome c, partial [Planctomycetes bacterium]|nr:cytochrome c [Planctomycetota bacterium]